MNNQIQQFHTGLFVDQKKRGVLLDIVQDLLRKQYQLVAVPGLPLPNRTCEIFLRPLNLHTSNVDIANAKVLLEKYLIMINESRPQMFVGKHPEVIDLEASDDERSDEASVVVVDLDESDVSVKGNNERKSSPIVAVHDDALSEQQVWSESSSPMVDTVQKDSEDHKEKDITIENKQDSDVIVVDEVDKTDSPKSYSASILTSNSSTCLLESVAKSASTVISNDADILIIDTVKKFPHSNTIVSVLLKDSNKQGKKRKKDFDVVEILDDDIIVLDDSFTVSNPIRVHSKSSEPELSVIDSSPRQALLKSDRAGSNDKDEGSSSKIPTQAPHPDTSQSMSVHQNVTKISENECENSSVDSSQSVGPPKKKSKLAYHRPAHLVKPLTQSTVPSTKVVSATNIYNPNADISEKRTGLRPIVIDGNNVAICHGKGSFSLKGIQICINYFEKRGHRQIKVFIPQYRRNRDTYDELRNLEQKGLAVITPSRRVNGKVVASYDDRYIVQYAAEFGGVIVSTDHFRDLMIENPSWKDTIENRLLMFTWVDDLLMFPQDPLGRRGPSLDDFLKFPDK